jgi:hypothetical protein
MATETLLKRQNQWQPNLAIRTFAICSIDMRWWSSQWNVHFPLQC